jgi:hypothetical protein
VTHQLPPRVVRIGRALQVEAGSYLHSTVLEPGKTCAVCAAPVDGYEFCIPCRDHRRSGYVLADRVGSLIYAVEPDSQAYRLVRNYKAPRPGLSHEGTMLALLAIGLRGHHSCAEKMANGLRSGWAVVPSTRGRMKLHELVAGLSTRPDAEVPVEFIGAEVGRRLHPVDWRVTATYALPPMSCSSTTHG